MASAVNEVTIKKEIEDPSEDQADTQDSGQNQSEQSSQKSSKVWCEDEIRSLIALAKHYIPKFKDSSYSKKQLLDDISNELQLIGYETTAENVRNKMKYLRTRYRGVVDYNSKHVDKRTIPFNEELTELYSLDYFDQNLSDLNGNGSNDILYNPPPPPPPSRSQKRLAKSVPASHVNLNSVVTARKRTGISPRSSRMIVKKKGGKGQRSQPLFQCGLCMEKFQTSFDMHGHECKPAPKVVEASRRKFSSNMSPPAPTVFHWNSLITMHFLELLKEYQLNHKNSNFRKGNIWDHMSVLMKRRGHTIQPKELEKKFNVLTSAYEKTVKYNKTHKDKKKCAFFKRLTELHKHPNSFDCFRAEEPVKMTVEVSPFSFATREPCPITSRSSSSNSNTQRKGNNDTNVPVAQNDTSELFTWLQSTWNEWKDMEKKREELMAQRHNELMEMLSYLIDSSGDNDTH